MTSVLTPPSETQESPGDFSHFVATEQVALRRYALALTGNDSDADDLLQATLVKLYLAWDRLEDHDHLGGYARTTMSRTFVSLWRSWGRHEVATGSIPDAPAPSGPGIAERDLIWRGLAKLGRRQRAIVVLRYFEDLDLAAIAETLGISVGTVKSQLSRAHANLRTALEGAAS